MAAAASKGYPIAQYYLGTWYAEGKALTVNEVAAFSLYTAAADQGQAQAQHMLGSLHLTGKGAPLDHAKAAFRFNQAANQQLWQSVLQLGLLYVRGEGVRKDPVVGSALVKFAMGKIIPSTKSVSGQNRSELLTRAQMVASDELEKELNQNPNFSEALNKVKNAKYSF
jgi:hypothetical protein